MTYTFTALLIDLLTAIKQMHLYETGTVIVLLQDVLCKVDAESFAGWSIALLLLGSALLCQSGCQSLAPGVQVQWCRHGLNPACAKLSHLGLGPTGSAALASVLLQGRGVKSSGDGLPVRASGNPTGQALNKTSQAAPLPAGSRCLATSEGH